MLKLILAAALLLAASVAHSYPIEHLVPVTQVRNAYATTPVTTSAWVQILAATPLDTSAIQSFDSSGQTLQLGVIPSGSTQATPTVYALLFPGGNGTQNLKIPGGASIWVKAVSGNATAGELDLNFFY